MTLGERIKKLRKDKDLTQQQFSEKIGTSANVLTNYETGRRNPSSSVINNICKTFDVREEWLRTGEGEMFSAKPTAALDALAVEHSLSTSDYIAIEKFLALKPESRKTITDYMMEVAASIISMKAEGFLPDDPAFPSSRSHGVPHTMEEVNEQADMFRSRLILDVRHQQRQDEAKTAKSKEHPLTIDEQVELYRQQLLWEKEQAKQASSAKESDGG